MARTRFGRRCGRESEGSRGRKKLVLGDGSRVEGAVRDDLLLARDRTSKGSRDMWPPEHTLFFTADCKIWFLLFIVGVSGRRSRQRYQEYMMYFITPDDQATNLRVRRRLGLSGLRPPAIRRASNHQRHSLPMIQHQGYGGISSRLCLSLGAIDTGIPSLSLIIIRRWWWASLLIILCSRIPPYIPA